PYQVRDGTACVLARIELEERGGVLVAPLDAVLVVEEHDAIGHGMRGAPKAGERVAELLLPAFGAALMAIECREHFLPRAATLRHLIGARILRPAGEPRQMTQVINKHDNETDRRERPGPRRTGKQRDRQTR